MSKIIFTQTIQKKAKQYGLADPAYLCYAAMRAAGIGINDAWNVAFQNEGTLWPKERLKAEQKKLEELEGVRKYIADTKGDGEQDEKAGELSPEELARATSKEQILTDLVIARGKLPHGTKEWADLTKMIGEFTRIKQDEIQTEDTTVHYFLPLNMPHDYRDCIMFRNGKCNPPCKKQE